MVIVAQLVRASDCGSEGRRFETGHSPKKKRTDFQCVFSFPQKNYHTSSSDSIV